MSVCAYIRTGNELTPKDLFNHLVNEGEQIVVTSDEFPSLKFGTNRKAIRGIEVNQEENGYEVSVFALSSVEDYQLFAKTTKAVMELTGGKAYVDNDDEQEIKNPLKTFGKEWIEQEREAMLGVTRALINHSGHQIVMFGLFSKFCIGPTLYKGFDISLNGSCDKDKLDNLQRYLCSVQWHFADLKDTSTRMVLSHPSGDAEKGLSLSVISINNGKVGEFDYISEAELFGLMDMDNNETIPPVLIPFKQLWKILPEGIFRRIDECQFERIGELTVDMVHEMMERARHLQPDDLFYEPKYPGDGFDEKQNTVILTWNTTISSVTLEQHNNSVKDMYTDYFNWNVWEYDKAKCGDRFFLVRVGEGKTGIVMSGVFDSNPYEINSSSSKKNYCCPIKIQV